jgi:hypothetical protein
LDASRDGAAILVRTAAEHCSADHSVGNQRPFGNIVDGTFSPLLETLGAAAGRIGSLGKALQDHEIGHDPGAPGLSQAIPEPSGAGAPKAPNQFPLIVH